MPCSCSDCEQVCSSGLVIPPPDEEFLIGQADGVAVIVGIIFGVFTIIGLVLYYRYGVQGNYIFLNW